MNIVFVGNDARDADFFKHEVENSAPAIHVDLSPSVLDAMVRVGTAGMCDIVVLDAVVPTADAVGLVSFIRKDKKPIAVVALVGMDSVDPPQALLDAGVDHTVSKRPRYHRSLPEVFERLHKQYHTDTTPNRRQVRLLFAGDFESAKRHLAAVSQLKLEPAPVSADGAWHIPETGVPAADALVLDLAVTGAQTLQVIKQASQYLQDTPIILLTNPGDDETAIHAIRSGAADWVTKTGNYFYRLLLVLQRELGRREITREQLCGRGKGACARLLKRFRPALP
jgi:DNA-binding response OmpR family regulator